MDHQRIAFDARDRMVTTQERRYIGDPALLPGVTNAWKQGVSGWWWCDAVTSWEASEARGPKPAKHEMWNP